MDWLTIVWLIAGYLAGSAPFGLLYARLFGLGDVRQIGSGNIGATNVLRTGSKTVAALTLASDIAKGAVPVWLAHKTAGETAALAAGLGAFVGHVFPLWLKFRGGKGVATYLGVVLALAWQLAVVFAVVWLGLAFLLRYSSVSSLAAVTVLPAAAALWLGNAGLAAILGLIAAVVWWAHRDNISRLLRGKESRIDLSGSSGKSG